ncbi:MAG: hypothetical protein HYY63_00615 [Elusimicrobia bacterium]|nr:hypothetical protein [Elusimicrobiota bacterium]
MVQLDISGTIQLDTNLLRRASANDTIFLIARPAIGGPPAAVQKFTGKNYPYSFHLTEQSRMLAGKPLDVPLNLTVRVDKDGDAITKNPGDLLGAYEKNPVPLQAENISITINEINP